MTKSEQMHARKAVVRALLEGRSFVLPLHVDPDGDSIGSCLAMRDGLRALGKEAIVVSLSPVPEAYHFLPGVDSIIPLEKWERGQETLVIMDTSDLCRTGIHRDMIEGMKVLNIDHHASNSGFGDVVYVDEAKSAVGEMVLEILDGLGASVTPQMATLLYAAVVTDTGSFRYDNTTESCLSAAARLVGLGAKPGAIAKQLFEQRRVASLLLLGQALSDLHLSQDGRVCWICVTREMMRRVGATDDDVDGIVSYTRMPRGVEVGVLFKEMEDGTTRVGLRANEYVDVGQMAKRRGGGGHARAAGFTFAGGIADAEREITEEAIKSAGSR